MPFEEYMAACLYDPEDGFFATGPLRSTKAGDFLTSPEVSPWFGRCLGRFVDQEYERVGRPQPFRVVDIGAGSGSLLTAMAAGFGAQSPGGAALSGSLDDAAEGSSSAPVEVPAHPTQDAPRSSDGAIINAVEWWAADASPAARDHLESSTFIDTVVADLGGTPKSLDGVIIANELLDNLPVAIVVREGDVWVERWVDVGGGDEMPFALVPTPARSEVAAWADRYAGKVPDGGLVEVQLAAQNWLEAALDRLGRGAVVVIDYGGTAEELEPRRTLGTLRTYRAHHLGPDPLAEPGETDVTVDVNFTALLAVAERSDVEVGLLRQDDFLTELGLRDELSRIRRHELDEARSGDPMQRLKLRSERTDAETLLHPRGLGDFRVLVAMKG